MINCLGKFLPDFFSVMHQSYNLLKSDDVWTWGELQKQGFTDVKAMLTTTLALAHYDPSKPTTASTDESSSGFTTKGSTSSDTQGSLRLH